MFVVDALPLELIGMNSAMTCNYIKFCADQLLIAFGCRRLYKVGNPFEWIETISLQGKTSKSQASSKKCLRITQNWVLESVIGHGIGGKHIPIMARLTKVRRWSKR